MNWLNDYAQQLGVDPLSAGDVDLILDLAREVAHGSERKNAPPAAYLAALFVASDRGDLSEAIQRARALINRT